MLYGLALVIFACAILVFFAEEFFKTGKSWLANPWLGTAIPMLLLSGLSLYFEPWLRWCFFALSASLLKAMSALTPSFLAQGFLAKGYTAAMLAIMVTVPWFGLHGVLQRRNHRGFPAYPLVILASFLLTTILFLISL